MFPVDRSKRLASFAQDADADVIARHRELILEIRALRSAIEEREDGRRAGHPAPFGGIHRLRHELDLIHAAIAATKQDLDALQSSKPQDVGARRVAKVVATLRFVADHIVNMMEIAGAREAGRDLASAAMAKRPRGRLASAQGDADPGSAQPYDIEGLLA
jgi:hypothetical protein